MRPRHSFYEFSFLLPFCYYLRSLASSTPPLKATTTKNHSSFLIYASSQSVILSLITLSLFILRAIASIFRVIACNSVVCRLSYPSSLPSSPFCPLWPQTTVSLLLKMHQHTREIFAKHLSPRCWHVKKEIFTLWHLYGEIWPVDNNKMVST